MLEGWEWIIILGLAGLVGTLIVVVVVAFLFRSKPQGITVPPPPPASYPANDKTKRLEQLKIMLDRGLITQYDYEEQKEHILSTV